MKTFFDKLHPLADQIDRAKGLGFFAVVHRANGLYDRWDLLISSPKLKPWSIEALRYIAGLLQKALTADELVRIARIVVLPPESEVITSLLHDDQLRPGKMGSPLDDRFDRALVLRPNGQPKQTVTTASARRR